MRFYPDSYGSDLREFNPRRFTLREDNDCHNPAGSPASTGGEFCSKPGVAGSKSKVKLARTKRAAWEQFRQASKSLRSYDLASGEPKPLDLPERPPRKRRGDFDRWDVTGVRPEMIAAVEAAAQHDLDHNVLFREMTETFGGYAVFVKKTPPGDNEVAGSYEGGAGVVLWDNVWTEHGMKDVFFRAADGATSARLAPLVNDTLDGWRVHYQPLPAA